MAQGLLETGLAPFNLSYFFSMRRDSMKTEGKSRLSTLYTKPSPTFMRLWSSTVCERLDIYDRKGKGEGQILSAKLPLFRQDNICPSLFYIAITASRP